MGLELRSGAGQTAKEIHALLSSIPKLPWYFRWVPQKLRPKAAEAYYLWKHRRSINRLLELRNQGTIMLETWYAQTATGVLLNHLRAVVDDLMRSVGKVEEELDALEITVRDALLDIESRGDERLRLASNKALNGWDDLLRTPAGHAAWLDHVYSQSLPMFETWLADLLAAEQIFSLSAEQNPNALASWLVERGMDAYQFLWTYSVDRVLIEQDKKDIHFSYNRMDASLPPLRPDYDASGSGAYIVTGACLIGSPDWEMCCLPDEARARWAVRFTGNPYMALWYQVRGGISAAAVEAVLAGDKNNSSGENSWSILRDGPNDEPGSLPEGSGTARFSWHFRPRGGKEVIPLKIDLPIDRARLEHYRRLPRLEGRWNVYAEEEMPEIRELALAFQALHVRRRWSTYTQASNVLSFVQQCIPYARDLDTTGHMDWPRYPIETLADRAGDCEDVAILCSAVLARLGFQVILLVYKNHVAFAVAGADNLKGDYIVYPATGARCFYGEATADGWRLGEAPKSYAGITPLQMLPVTILMDKGPKDETTAG